MNSHIYNFLKPLCKRIYFFPGKIINYPFFVMHGVKFGKRLDTVGKIYIKNLGNIKIGNYVRIRSSQRANPIGCGTKTFLRTFVGGNIEIGDNTAFSNCAFTSAKSIIIGNNVMIGGGVRIFDTDFHSVNGYIRMQTVKMPEQPKVKPVIIEDYAFIGAGSIILKGSNIGAHSVIGAGSVVTGKVPSGQVWAGNPAKFIRNLTEEELSLPENIGGTE